MMSMKTTTARHDDDDDNKKETNFLYIYKIMSFKYISVSEARLIAHAKDKTYSRLLLIIIELEYLFGSVNFFIFRPAKIAL